MHTIRSSLHQGTAVDGGRGTAAERLSRNDSDYSSDSSLNTTVAGAPFAGDAPPSAEGNPRTAPSSGNDHAARRRGRAAVGDSAGGAEGGFNSRDTLLGHVYRHGDTRRRAPSQSEEISASVTTDAQRVEATKLADLVNLGTQELLRRAWGLMPSTAKTADFPPFRGLPNCPNILEVTVADTEDISHFMSETATELASRRSVTTPVHLRALLVRSAVAGEALRLGQGNGAQMPLDNTLLQPEWETDLDLSGELDCDAATTGGSLGEVNSIDFMVALGVSDMMMGERMSTRTLALLHQLVNRNIGESASPSLLKSWGVQYINTLLIKQMDSVAGQCTEAEPATAGTTQQERERDRQWLSLALGLAYKIAVGSSNTNHLLSLWRFTYTHSECTACLPVAGAAALLQAVNTADVGRLHLPLPAFPGDRAPQCSLEQAVTDLFHSVSEFVVYARDGETFVVLLTDMGLFCLAVGASPVVESTNAIFTSANTCGLVMDASGNFFTCLSNVGDHTEQVDRSVDSPTSESGPGASLPSPTATTVSIHTIAADTLTVLHSATPSSSNAHDFIMRWQADHGITSSTTVNVAVGQVAQPADSRVPFQVHLGDGKLVQPYYACSAFGCDANAPDGALTDASPLLSSGTTTGAATQVRRRAQAYLTRPTVRYATFTAAAPGTGLPVQGCTTARTNPVLPRDCDALSVQFYLRPIPHTAATSFHILTVTLGMDRVWLDVEVRYTPVSGTLRLVFTHGSDTAAEVEEPCGYASGGGHGHGAFGVLSQEMADRGRDVEPGASDWVLWSASLSSVNDIASWNIYRNGVLCDIRQRNGTLVRPGAVPVEVAVFSGSFNGQVAVLQAWTRAQNVADMRAAAVEGVSRHTSALLVDFPLREGVGCCLHSTTTGHEWCGRGLGWAPAPVPLPVRHVWHTSSSGPSDHMLWEPKPAVPYRVATNGFETVILGERGTATWIDGDGRILEQRPVHHDPSTHLVSYCPNNGKLFRLSTSAPLTLRAVALSGPTAQEMSDLVSVTTSKAFFEEVLRKDTAPVTTPSSPAAAPTGREVAEFLIRNVSTRLLTDGSESNASSSASSGAAPPAYSMHSHVLSLRDTGVLSLRSMARLLSVVEDVVAALTAGPGRGVQPWCVLLLSLCGRLLMRQARIAERRCPARVVPLVVSTFRFLQSVTGAPRTPASPPGATTEAFEVQEELAPFLAEALLVFDELHKVVLADCVSHDYQLKLITECANLKEVKQLLIPENLPPLVASVIAKDLKRPLMTFLNRLKEECLAEAGKVLQNARVDFRASEALLTVLCGMLAQRDRPQWHLVAIALLVSLCKSIVKAFEQQYTSPSERASRVSVLKRTAIGVVIYPVVHYLYGMELDQSVAASALKVLDEMRTLLTSLPATSPSVSSHGLPPSQHGDGYADSGFTHKSTVTTGDGTLGVTEVHTLSTPAQLRGPYTAVLHLQHASRVRVEVTCTSVTQKKDGRAISADGNARSTNVMSATAVTQAVPGSLEANGPLELSSLSYAHVSLIDNTLVRHSQSVVEGEVAFECGGRLLVECGQTAFTKQDANGSTTNIPGSGGVNGDEARETALIPVFSFVVHADVHVPLEQSSWLAEICSALTYTIISVTQANLLHPTTASAPMELEQYLRGGLSTERLRAGVAKVGADRPSLRTTAGLLFQGNTPGAGDDDTDEEGVEVHRQLCCIAEAEEATGGTAPHEDSEQAKLSKVWSELFEEKKFPYADRLRKVVRWISCAVAWHQLRPAPLLNASSSARREGVTAMLQKELSRVMDWLKPKRILLLEAVQQHGTPALVERARFLLKDLSPRCRAEARLAEVQHTEEPLESGTRGAHGHGESHALSRAGGSVGRSFDPRSRKNNMSYRKTGTMAAETLDMTFTSSRFGTSRMPTRATGTSAAMKLFSTGVRQETDSTLGQLFDFVIKSSKSGSIDDLRQHLFSRVLHATAQTMAFNMQETLCRAYEGNPHVVASILLSHLAFRNKLAKESVASHTAPERVSQNSTGDAGTEARPRLGGGIDRGTASHAGYGSHYAAHVLGCGLRREWELQQSVCGFVRTALRVILRRLRSVPVPPRGGTNAGVNQPKTDGDAPWQGANRQTDGSFPMTESLAMCALLCHPWDSVDMSILQPQEIFTFLRCLLSASLSRRVEAALATETGANAAKHYEESKGLFDLFHRALIVPNALLQVSVEGVRVFEGEVQGVQVEGTKVVCTARNHWKALTGSGKVPSNRGVESDLFANYGMPCVVSELPDVLYFEITLDLSNHDPPSLAIGLSNSSLSAVENIAESTNVVVFSSDGMVRFPGLTERTRFSEAWEVNDVIGCGVFAPHNSVFFTRNGHFLGATGPCPFSAMIPFVEANATGSLLKVIVNFGEETPFKYDPSSFHCSCRRPYLSSSTLCDAAYTTVYYLIMQCYRNLSVDDADTTGAIHRDAVSHLLERAASFLNTTILELVEVYREHATRRTERHVQGSPAAVEQKESVDLFEEPLACMISRLFHCVSLVIECFAFDAVTPKTHVKVLHVCALTLSTSHDKWVKIRAAECLSRVRQVMREDYLAEATSAFRRMIPAEEIVQHLVELARAKVVREVEPPLPPPKWMGGAKTVRGKGVFFGATPLPKKGTHMVGFRIRRRNQMGQGVGAPLGGCYYLGLCHGQPPISSMNNLITRTDVYVLQDTDDQDQVPHLLLKRQCIPRNSHRRIFGNDEVVWVQFNADQGEITFYRENMILIGLAFANIQKCDDLFPMVYHFNDDASCELLEPPSSTDESSEHLSEKLRRSVAIHTLQQLHLVKYFAGVISQFIQRSVTQQDRDLDNCLVALGILGGERSYLYCQNETYGLLVVRAIADVSGKVVVYSANDENRHVFCVSPQSLKPSFIQTPLYASGIPEADSSASLLLTELNRSLYDASVVAPLLREEGESRRLIEAEYSRSLEETTTLDLTGLLSCTMAVTSTEASCASLDTPQPRAVVTTAVSAGTSSSPRSGPQPYNSVGTRPVSRSLAAYPPSHSDAGVTLAASHSLGGATAHKQPPGTATLSATAAPAPVSHRPLDASASSSLTMLTMSAVVVDRMYSTKSVYTPSPSIAVTASNCCCSTIRANAVFENSWRLAVSLSHQPSFTNGGSPSSAGRVSGAGLTGTSSGGDIGGAPEDTLPPLLYVGVTSTVKSVAKHVEDVQNWQDAWALCNIDSNTTNNVNCSVEPGIISASDEVLFGSGDILIMDVNRSEGTVAFSRLRRGKRVDLGVLFEGLPTDRVLRPLVACGPDTVVVFSFLNEDIFPARNTFPVCNFTSRGREPTQCSVCEVSLTPPWYGGEDGVALCDFCFTTWQYPKDLFYVGACRPGLPTAPPYVVSSHIPRRLTVGAYVECEENLSPVWAEAQSVNVETGAGLTAVAVFEEAFAVTEPLSRYGNVRVDAQVGHVAGVAGCPFSGLLPFVPLWRDEEQTRTTCVVQGESLVISASVIPSFTKTVFSVRITETKPNQPVSFTGVFIGMTNMSDTTYTVTRADLDRLCANNNVWGSWCDSRDKISPDGVIYVLVDTMQGTLMLSTTLGGLHHNPFVVTCSVSLNGDAEESLRLVLFSHETCRVTSAEGLTSCNELSDPSYAPVAIGLVPEDSFGTPSQHVFADAIMIMDTVQQTQALAECSTSPRPWHYTSQAITCRDGVLFAIDDTVTIVLERHPPHTEQGAQAPSAGATVRFFCQGVLVCTRELSAAESERRYRVALYLSACGLTTSFVPPVYGRTHLGRILSVHGGEVCVVESVSESVRGPPRQFAVRRRDVRFCASAASTFPDPAAVLTEGARVAFRLAPIQPPKRGAVAAFSGSVVSVSENDSDRSMTHLTLEQCFVLDNEDGETARVSLYPLVTPPTSTITKLFEVGKSKYRQQSKASYNGIVFDCKTNDTIELVGLSVLSQTSGRHRADVFFKRGSHRHHERDARSWTSIFSGFVDMQVERQFPVTFTSIYVDAGSTFSLYINTSHNCGVGFFCEEDGCQGEVGNDLDDDGTVTVLLGRKSGSSAAFGDFSLTARGFAGTIMYKQNKGSKPPLIEGDLAHATGLVGGASAATGGGGAEPNASSEATGPTARGAPKLMYASSSRAADVASKHALAAMNGEVTRLVSRPVVTESHSCVWFTVCVPKTAVRLESIRLPVVLDSWTRRGGGEVHFMGEPSASMGDGEHGEGLWHPQSQRSSCFGLLHCVVSLLHCKVADATGHPSMDTLGADGTGDLHLPVEHVARESSLFAGTPDDSLMWDECGPWCWDWNSRVLVDSYVTEVDVCGLDIRLAPGTYRFAAVIRESLGEHSDEFSLRLVQAADPSHTVRTPLLAVKGFYGDLIAEADSPTVTGELHTMTTGAFLNQSNSASYNGIMFDLRSKQDVTLEEVFCVSQTSSEHVAVRLFWKEGSMEGAEKSPMQWREIATKEMQLVDKQSFSVGPVFLRMKANQVYSLFVNTSSSCGVRFYNSSDGHVGDIGDEFENDGIMTVYVGRKSEASTPFAEIPMEPRAFRGKLVYRTHTSTNSDLVNHAMFSYFRAFIVTRMLVALSSFVDSSVAPTGPRGTDGRSAPSAIALHGSLPTEGTGAGSGTRFSYESLLAIVSTLATSPSKSITDIIGAENLLSRILKDTHPDDLRSGAVCVPLAPEKLTSVSAINVGDIAVYIADVSGILPPPSPSAASASHGSDSAGTVVTASDAAGVAGLRLVTVLAVSSSDATALVCPYSDNTSSRHGNPCGEGVRILDATQQAETAVERPANAPAPGDSALCVPLRSLLPVTKCWRCHLPHASSDICAVSGTSHAPPMDEEHRMAAIVANKVLQKFKVSVADAHALAKGLLRNPHMQIRDLGRRCPATRRKEATKITCTARATETRSHAASVPTPESYLAVPSRRLAGNSTGSPRMSYALFRVPTSMLLPEREEAAVHAFNCPFVFSDVMRAYVSLRLVRTADGIRVEFITDRPLRLATIDGASEALPTEAFSLQLYAIHNPSDFVQTSPDHVTFVTSALEDAYTAGAAPWKNDVVAESMGTPLLTQPFTYIGTPSGCVTEMLLASALSASVCSFFSRDGATSLCLTAHKAPLPRATKPIPPLHDYWRWEDGSAEAQLTSAAPVFLHGSFLKDSWPSGKPRFCSLMVVPKGKDKTVFLEVHVVHEIRRGPGYLSKTTKTTSKTHVRKPFNLASGEVVTAGFSTDGDFFICDAEDVIRCLIRADELASPSVQQRETVCQRVGFLSVDHEKVSAQLSAREHGSRVPKSLYSPEIRNSTRRDGDGYEPLWRCFDPQRVTVSRNNLVAGCCTDVGGQAVVGAVMPESGVSAFVVTIQRHDREDGRPLGSGHFAGVCIASFQHMAPHYSEMKSLGEVVWAVQDVQDDDSQPGQSTIPPMRSDEGRGNELFRCGTKLLFVMDRAAGTLSLARGDESPLVIFNGLPREGELCPFVRLDHTTSYATLSRFSTGSLSNGGRLLYQPTRERMSQMQPVTASFLRKVPFAMVLKLFPVMLRLVAALPSSHAAQLEKSWSDVSVCNRFQYRLTLALDALVDLGAFGRDMLECDEDVVDALFAKKETMDVIRSLAVIPTGEVVAIPLHSAAIGALPRTLVRREPPVRSPATVAGAPPAETKRSSPLLLSRGDKDPDAETDSPQSTSAFDDLKPEHTRTRSLFNVSGFLGNSSGGGAAKESQSTGVSGRSPLENAKTADAAQANFVYFRIPSEYEVVGCVPGTRMTRLMYMDASSRPVERTLHLVQLDRPSCGLHLTDEVLPHPSAMHQCEILQPLVDAKACGVITDGWFDCTLADVFAAVQLETVEGAHLALTSADEHKIATSLLCGVEHWHLHGFSHGHVCPSNIYLRLMNGSVEACTLWNAEFMMRTDPYASPWLQSSGSRTLKDDLWSCAAVFRRMAHLAGCASPSLQRCTDMLEEENVSISQILQDKEVFVGRNTEDGGGEGPSFTLRTGAHLRGGSGSYNGIMFDVVAKSTTIRLTRIGFVPDTNATATVSLYARLGSFLGVENSSTAWQKVVQKEMLLSDNQETFLDGFEPLTIPAGCRAGLFLHTTNGSGVLFYSETEGVLAAMGQVEEENNDVGITVGKKSESSQPFTSIQNQKRLLKGSITYTLITRSNGPRSSLIYSHDARAVGIGVSTENLTAAPQGSPTSQKDRTSTLGTKFAKMSVGSLQPVLVSHLSAATTGDYLHSATSGLDFSVGLRVAMSHPTGDYSLVTTEPGVFTWVPTELVTVAGYRVSDSKHTTSLGSITQGDVHTHYPSTTDVVVDNPASAERLAQIERFIMGTLKAHYYECVLPQRLRAYSWPVLRRLSFRLSRPVVETPRNDVGLQQASLTEGSSHNALSPVSPFTKSPSGRGGALVWVSEPITWSCTVSLSVPTQRRSGTAVDIVFGNDFWVAREQQEPRSPSFHSSTEKNYMDGIGMVSLHFDTRRRCVVTSTGELIPWTPSSDTSSSQLPKSTRGDSHPTGEIVKDRGFLLPAYVVVRHSATAASEPPHASSRTQGGQRTTSPHSPVSPLNWSRSSQAAGPHRLFLGEDSPTADARRSAEASWAGEGMPSFPFDIYVTCDKEVDEAGVDQLPCCGHLGAEKPSPASRWVRVSEDMTVYRDCVPATGDFAPVGPAATASLAFDPTSLSPCTDTTTAAKGTTCHLRVDAVCGTPVHVAVTPLSGTSPAAPVVRPLALHSTADEEEVSLPVEPHCGLLLETWQTGTWASAMEEVTFASHSTALDVTGRTITQVLYSSASKCLVLTPSFSSAEKHEITLRVSCPRDRLFRLALEPTSTPSEGVGVPLCLFDRLGDELFGATQQVQLTVHLHVDMSRHVAYASTSSGTFVNAFHGRPTAFSTSAEVRLAVTLLSPGSRVEILSWRRSSASTDVVVNTRRLEAIAETLGEKEFSPNVAPTTGIITRHSSRGTGSGAGAAQISTGTHTSSRGIDGSRSNPADGGAGFSGAARGGSGGAGGRCQAAATKQMEVLMVSYARLLLEKALVAQDSARKAVQRQLHALLSYTSLRTSAAIASVLEHEFRTRSFQLVAQSCAQLLAPSILQSTASVETSVNVLVHSMGNSAVRAALRGPLGPAVILSLLRTATVYTRSTRHTALKCAQELLSHDAVPLPTHALLTAHLAPLLRMMGVLCRRGKTSSAVVQIGVTLIADLITRYRRARPGVVAPGVHSEIPFPVVVCARAVVDALSRQPPIPLPAALTKEQMSAHRILRRNPNTQEKPTLSVSAGAQSVFATFTETNRELATEKSFEVVMGGPRKGAVVLGWDLEGETAAQESAHGEGPTVVGEASAEGGAVPLPSCGYYIEPQQGKVYVCLGRKREEQPLKVRVKPGDVIVVTCSYAEPVVHLVLRRGGNRELRTNFNPTVDEKLAMPFYFAENRTDAEPNFTTLMVAPTTINVMQMYADLQEHPESLDDAVPPQSLSFYTELNLFAQTVLTNEKLLRAETETVPTHDIAGFTLLNGFLGANAFADETPLKPLAPYLKRLQLFDALTSAFSPLINLQRKSELFDIFRVLKNLCGKETEEKIQEDVMRPFHNRPGRKAHVTIHTMQAQPSASLGPSQTLIRSIFGQLYLQLQRSPMDTFYVSPIFTVKLAGFGSTDAGGPYRDVLSQLASEIMTPHPSNQFQLNPLFVQCGRGDAEAVLPNPDLAGGSQSLLMLEFFGKLLASFFVTSDLLAVEFPPLFWKLLLGEKTSVQDLASIDPDIVRELEPEELMDRSEEELEERFPGIGDVWRRVCADNPQLGRASTLPPTTLEAAQALSDRIVESEMNRFAEAIECIQRGFDMVIPLYTLQAFRWQKVELLICGTQKLSFEAFKNECDIQLPTNEAASFLSVLEGMSDEDRTLLLRFTTGQSRLPLRSRIKVQHNGSKNSLPTSSTCFFTLRLPTYSSEDVMKERLLYAIRQCKAIDADGQARENLMLDG